MNTHYINVDINLPSLKMPYNNNIYSVSKCPDVFTGVYEDM